MKSIIFMMMAITFVTIISCHPKLTASKSATHVITDSRGNKMILGESNRQSLQEPPFASWFIKNYSEYQLDSSTCDVLKGKLAHKKLEIFMGTWCGDSRREVPRMFRILDYCQVKPSQVKLVMLGNTDTLYKQSPEHEEWGLEIHRVPDLIVYDHQKEIGRIVEEPVVSLEKDLLAIVNGDIYTSSYPAVSMIIELFKKNPSPYSEIQLNEFAVALKPFSKSTAELNTYGYVKMTAGEMGKAEAAFKINIILYGNTGDVYDSMGDYYVKNNQLNLAKENYQKSLQLDSANDGSRKKLLKLQNN